MSFTYTNNPAVSNRDAVRFLLHDTTETGALLTDEEITFLLTRGSVYLAAAAGAVQVAARYGDSVTRTVGDLSESGAERAVNYLNLAKEFRRLAASGLSPFSAGISVADKDATRDDDDYVAPTFTAGFMDSSYSVAITDSSL